MKIELEPTPEIWNGPVNGVEIPFRIWRGQTSGGIPIEAYLLSITPDHEGDIERLQSELPPFMVRSRDAFEV